jgi:hypothetical protein
MKAQIQDELQTLQTVLSENGIRPHDATRNDISSLFNVSDGRARTLQRHLRVLCPDPRRVPFLDKLTKTNLEKVFAKKHEADIARDEIEAIKQELKGEITLAPLPKVPPQTNTGRLLELHIPDLHVSKLAWALETSNANYDTGIAVRVYEEAVATLLDRTSAYTFDAVLMVIGSDMSHTDNLFNTTTAGTPQDVDGRYQKNFIETRRMISRTIDMVKRMAPVRGLVIPGNHDTLTSFHVGDSLECLYHNDPLVTIDNRPTFRKYFQWGKVLIGVAHGDKPKAANLPLLMAVEQPQMWADSFYREWHVGHLHTLKVTETMGVRTRISPSLAPPDAWHAHNGYVGNLRSAVGMVWDREDGLISEVTYTIAPPKG